MPKLNGQGPPSYPTLERRRSGAIGFRVSLWAFFLLWALVFFWLGSRSDPFWRGYAFKPSGSDYYNLLVDGFSHGRLSLDAPVHADLLSPDPLVRSRAPYLLDAALFRGRYYLFYGVTPAAILLYPYALATGGHLSPSAANLAFAVLGLGIATLWLSLLRDHLSADWGSGMAATAVSVLAAVPGVALLVRRSSFYDLPASAGYLCMNAVWLALWIAAGRRRPLLWLALASGCFGLAVGCRANLVLLVPPLAIYLWCRRKEATTPAASYWAACVAPASVIGAGLAWYNYARFGNPLDFGFGHGLNSFFDSGKPLVSLEFLPSNLAAYLLAPPALAPWFPFDFPTAASALPRLYGNAEAMSGFLPVTILAAWLCIAVLMLRGKRGSPGAYGPWALLVGAAAAAELLFTLLLGIRAYRYGVDFLAPASLLLVLALSLVWAIPGAIGRIARLGACLSCVLLVAHTLLSAVQLFDEFKNTRTGEFARLSSLANPRQATLGMLGAPKPGGIRLSLRFSRPESAAIIPIVTTGLPSASDSVRAVVYPNGYVKFDIFHSGYGGPESELLPVAWDRAYPLEIFMGSLYPPADDPYFAAWPKAAVAAVKSSGLVRFAGKTVIGARMAFFESSPWAVVRSASPKNEPVVSIGPVERGLPAPAEVTKSGEGPEALYAVELSLPAARTTRPLPLLASGVTGNGDLLFFDPLPDGRYRLAVDEWGYGDLFGEPFAVVAGQPSLVEIVVGPALWRDAKMAPIPRQPGVENRIFVWFNGRLVGAFEITHHLESFGTLALGRNYAGFTSAERDLPGRPRQVDLTEGQRRDLMGRAVSAHPGP